MKNILLSSVIVLILVCTSCGTKEAAVEFEEMHDDIQIDKSYYDEQSLNNISAFARLYGYVRFFHPSKETEELDWDKFAVYGVSKVKDARNNEELLLNLQDIFTPIAPSIRISAKPIDYTYIVKDADPMLSWQHFGVKGILGYYRSEKVNIQSKIFSSFPSSDEVIIEEFCEDLYAYIPVCLSSKDALLENSIEEQEYLLLLEEVDAINTEKGKSLNEDVRLADIVITWNYFQHFYPYFDVVDVDWDNQLVSYIERARFEQSYEEFRNLLREMLVPLKDGHIDVYDESYSTFSELIDAFRMTEWLPIRLDLIEDNVVVVNSLVEDVKQGDIVVAIDGENTNQWIDEERMLISGSDQWKTYKALKNIIAKSEKEESNIRVMRGGKSVEVNLPYQSKLIDRYDRKENYCEIEKGIFYIKLDEDFRRDMLTNKDMENVKGIVFDNRGYPSRDFPAVIHEMCLKDGPVFSVPQTNFPNRRDITFNSSEITISRSNKLIVPYVFLIDAEARSKAEILPAYVSFDDRGILVGQPTTGVNGNINGFTLPGNYTVTFTGELVENPDGSSYHGIGIEPDYFVERTVEGVEKGQDEYLEKAIELLREMIKRNE